MKVIFSFLSSDTEQSPTYELFRQIDLDKDGLVYREDVKKFLLKFNIKITKENVDFLVDTFMSRCGVLYDEPVTEKVFARYVSEQDRQLSPIYAQIDTKMEGKIDLVDIQNYFLGLGVPIELSEAKLLIRRIDKSGPEAIEYSQWRKFLLFQPICSMTSIANYWKHGSVIDLSYDPVITIPSILKTDMVPGRDIIQLAAGAVAGVVSRTCTAPIDRLKVMRQVYGYKHKSSGFAEAYRYMFREGGLLSLWRGNLVNAIKIAPETAIKYTTYERYKLLLIDSNYSDFFSVHPTLTKFSAGAMAGLTAQTVIYPMEVLRTRMCLRKTGQYSSIADCGRHIFKELGFLGFYRGYFVNLVGILPYAGIELATYETTVVSIGDPIDSSSQDRLYLLEKKSPGADTRRLPLPGLARFSRGSPGFGRCALNGQENSQEAGCSSSKYVHPPARAIPVLGATASMIAIVATYPMALIRAKLQASFYYKQPSTVDGMRPKITVPSLLKAIWRDDGVIGLYRGLGTNLIKVLPATAISLLTYETIRRKCNLGPMGSG